MKTANLQLRNQNGPQATVYVEYSAGRKIKRVPTGVKVITRLYNPATATILADGSPNPKTDTATIRGEKTRVNAILAKLYHVLGRDATVEELTTALEAQAAPVSDTTLILPALTEYVAHKKLTKQPATGKSWATLAANVKDFQGETKTNLKFGSITLADITKFQNWLLQRGYLNSTCRKRLTLLKQFLSDSSETHVISNLNVTKIKPLHSLIKVPPFTLSLAEIESIRGLDLTSARLIKVRDMFTLQCFTGLRYSDLIRIQPQHIKNGYLILRMQKTKAETRIPVFPQALEVLNKYRNEDNSGFTLPRISNQKQNNYLKEIAVMIPELHKTKHIDYSQGNETLTKEVPAYELVSTHTARRSLITLLLNLNYPAHEVMQISGHKTYAAFSAYIGESDLDPRAADKFTAAYNAALAKL